MGKKQTFVEHSEVKPGDVLVGRGIIQAVNIEGENVRVKIRPHASLFTPAYGWLNIKSVDKIIRPPDMP